MTALDRSRPPLPGALLPFSFPAVAATAVGAIDFYHLPHHGGLTAVELLFPAGGLFAPRARPGLPALAAAASDEGTTTRDVHALAAAVDRLGGRLQSSCDWDSAGLSLVALDDAFEQAFAVFADVSCRPSFPEREVERLRHERLADLMQRRNDPSALAGDALALFLYRGTVYQDPLAGTRAAVEAVTRQELIDFWSAACTAGRPKLIAVGGTPRERLAEWVGAQLAELGGGAPRPLPAVTPDVGPDEAPGRAVVVVDRPDAAQTELRIGQVGPPRNHADWTALQVWNSVLGGKFTSRLNLNLRERHAFTYGAHSSFGGRLAAGPFVIGAAVANEHAGAAVREALGELERACAEPVNGDELRDAHAYLIGIFPYSVQTLYGVLSRLEDMAVFGLPSTHYATYAARIAAIDQAGALAAAQRHLCPERTTIAAAGPARLLEPTLSPFGPVTVLQPHQLP